MAKGMKGSYRIKCNFPGCKIKKNTINAKAYSIHTLPKNASKETVAKWAKVVPNVLDENGEIAKNFRYTFNLKVEFKSNQTKKCFSRRPRDV